MVNEMNVARKEKGIQGDNSDVLSVLADHLPIQLATRYFVKYHESEDKLSIVASSGGVETLRNVSAYREPVWHFDGKFVNGQGHVMANVQKATIWIFQLSLPVTIIHVERLNGTSSV